MFINDTLPNEMLEYVFKYLSPHDLCTVMLVCNRWKEACEHPKLWHWLVLKVNQNTQMDLLDSLSSKRFRGVTRMVVHRNVNMSNQLMSNLNPHSALRYLDMSRTVLDNVEPALLAYSFKKITSLDLSCATMTHNQIRLICMSLKEGTQLRSLNMDSNDLSLLEPDVLANGITQLNGVIGLCNTNLTLHQVNAICNALIQEGRPEMRALSLQQNDLSLVDPELLASAVTQFQNVNLFFTQLTAPQIVKICQKKKQNLRFERLNLGSNSNTCYIDPQMFKNVIVQYKRSKTKSGRYICNMCFNCLLMFIK